MKIHFAVIGSEDLLGRLKHYYRVPDIENAMDELLARTLCVEFAKIPNPLIQHTDMAMDMYDIKDLGHGRFAFALDERVYKILKEEAPYKDMPEEFDGVVSCVRCMLQEGLKHEAAEQGSNRLIPGFGQLSNGKLKLTSKEIEHGFKVFRKA